MMMMRRKLVMLVGAIAMTWAMAGPAAAIEEQQELIDRAEIAARSLLGDEANDAFRRLVARAQAVLIVPRLIKGGFFLGGEGGTGVLLKRQDDGSWSDPAFYALGGASLGIQFGAQTQELILAVMTERGVDALVERRFRLGGDAGIAVGTVGQGAEAATGLDLQADMYALSNVTGLFGGAALEGSIVKFRDAWNGVYYGTDASPSSILNAPGSRAGTGALRRTLSVYASPAR